MAVQWDLYEMYIALKQAPLYHLIIEGLLMIWVAWLLLRKPKIRKPKLTVKVCTFCEYAYFPNIHPYCFFFCFLFC